MAYKELGRSIENYAAPVWSTNAIEYNLGKIQRAQNEAFRIITGHHMSSIDHLHSETDILTVEDHLNLLSAQYLVHYLDTENVSHHITKMDQPPREMKETIFTRHNQTVLPLLANNEKDTLQAIHTSFVNRAIDNMTHNNGLQTTHPTSGGAVTADTSYCANCVLTPDTDITPSHRSRPWSSPIPTFHLHHLNQNTDTRPTLPLSPQD